MDKIAQLSIATVRLWRPTDVLLFTDYYAFGSPMPGRNFSSSSYRYGFNGKENDNEIKDNGNSLDFGARIYDPRLGRWLSTDPLQAKYPGVSPYIFTFNNPIIFNDPDGKDGRLTVTEGPDGSVNVTLATVVHIYGKDADVATAAALTKAYHDAGFDKTRSFKGADGKTYNVAFKITYSAENAKAIKEQQLAAGGNTGRTDIYEASSLDKSKVKNFIEGDNIMEIDGSKNLGVASGVTGYSNGALIGAGATGKTTIHEPLHMLGFDEAYDITKMYTDMPGMKGDVMTGGEGYIYQMSNGKPHPEPDFEINPIHYQNLINYVIDKKITDNVVIDPNVNKYESTGAGTRPPPLDKIESARKSEIKK